MLRIITEKNFKLGAYLQEQIDRQLLQLDDHAILKESEAWLDWDALVHSSSHKSVNSEYLSKERESRRVEWDRLRSHKKHHRRTRSEE